MAKRKEIDLEYKVWLVEECLAKRMRGREAARRAGVGATTMHNWISRYRAEGAEALAPVEEARIYDSEFKQKAAEEYIAGKGSALAIAEKYKIRSPQLVIDWTKKYNRHNGTDKKEGSPYMAKNQKHTLQERVQVVKEHLEDGESINSLAQKYRIPNQSIRNWVEKYQTMGISGLEDRRGQRLASQTPRTPEEELRIKYAQLEQENYLLRMENALLKKVKELERGQD